jgi:predicted nucleotidyltransferase
MSERHERALEVVSERLKQEFDHDLLGLLVAGSVAYGTPTERSDLDLFVLIRPAWRQRRKLVVEGIEVDLYINPVPQIRRKFGGEYNKTIDMFAKGRIVYDPQGLLAELVAEARQIKESPPMPPEETYDVRYHPTQALRDAEDLADVDPQAASLQLSVALRESLEAMFRREGKRAPKPKHLLQVVAERSPDIAGDARRVLDGAIPIGERIELLRHLTERILAPIGGLLVEGETKPQAVLE